MGKRSTRRRRGMTGAGLDALPVAETERIFRELDHLTDAQVKAARPLTPAEKRRQFQPPRRPGRPRLGKAGTAIISASIEKSLLRDVNAYARAKGIKRPELIASALRSVIGKTG